MTACVASSTTTVVSAADRRRSILNALKGCTKLKDLEQGKALHVAAIEAGVDSHLSVENTLVDMYAKCGSLLEAQKLFDGMHRHNVVSWNVLILGYADNGKGKEAWELFQIMLDKPCTPDAVTFVAALKACIGLAECEVGKQVDAKLVKVEALEKGVAIHTRAVHASCNWHMKVAGTLVDMYAHCGNMKDAEKVFNGICSPDTVCWNVVISGHAKNGEAIKALKLYNLMVTEGHNPTSVTYVAVLKACGILGALEIGEGLHAEICSRGLDKNILVATSLIDFYGRCWCMGKARQVFDALATKDVVAWTALLAGYGRHGDVDAVLALFGQMQDREMRPNAVTLLCVLTACSHAGLLDKGKEIFHSIYSRYGIVPGIEHYTCMADMLGRANKLEDAVKLVQEMPLAPRVATWKAVLSACWKWKNVELGRLVFESLLELDSNDPAAYVLMRDTYESRPQD